MASNPLVLDEVTFGAAAVARKSSGCPPHRRRSLERLRNPYGRTVGLEVHCDNGVADLAVLRRCSPARLPDASSCAGLLLRERGPVTQLKPVSKRKPPTQLIVSEESKAWLDARLKSEEGQRGLDQFATLIIEWAIAQMPTDLLEALVKEKGHATLKEIWPDIVDAYFKALSNPGPRK
jgi:hypothetical protein